MIRTAVVGGSGYTGSELARLLSLHPEFSLECLTSRKNAGAPVSKVHPFLKGFTDLRFEERLNDSADYDLVFVATPYGTTMDITASLLEKGTKVVELSGDYRLKDPQMYKEWYGTEHKDIPNLAKAAYGIPELFADEIRKAQLVANPGCYPTCAVLALAPLFAQGMIKGTVIVDAKSGTSGAGQEPSPMTHHPACDTTITPYKVGRHRHQPEIQMALEKIKSYAPEVLFAPHLVPIVRGILCTCYADFPSDISNEDLQSLYARFYRDKVFVRIEPVPSIPSVTGSNFVEVHAEKLSHKVVAIGAIDNLVKGAAGQAIQNANLMFGLEESTGIDFPGLGV